MIAPRDDSAPFPITEAQILGNYCETLAYGMYLVTCCFCAQSLFWIQVGGVQRLRQSGEIRWFLVSVFWFIFVVNTFDNVIGLVHNLGAFVKYKGSGGAEKELTNTHDWINIARSFAQAANMIVGDSVLIYRCFVVYNRRWPVIAPSFILYLTGIAMAIKLVQVVITTPAGNGAITSNSKAIGPWWSAFFVIIVAQNVLTTPLIFVLQLFWYGAYGAWNTKMRCSAAQLLRLLLSSNPRLRKVIRVVAESGLAYTTLLLMTFVLSVCNSNALYPISDVTLQAAGITFNVIIIRSTPRRDEQFSTFDNTERGMVPHAEGPPRRRAVSRLQFVSHPAAAQITVKSMTDQPEDGDNWRSETYSIKDVGAV